MSGGARLGGQYPLFPLPPAERPLRELEYVVVDVETTGGSVRTSHRVIEIAAVVMDGTGRTIDEFRSLVNPERPIPRNITALTGISEAMVRDAPCFHEVAEQVERVLGDRVFVAHNAGYDLGFVGFELIWALRTAPEARVLCTLRLARKLVPEIRRRSLASLCWYFGIEHEAPHRAWADARATAAVLARLFERLEEREIYDWEALEKLLAARPPRRKRSALPQPMQEVYD